jgi:ubiquinone/menaquinone biosynthesis C-methylase UbiE
MTILHYDVDATRRLLSVYETRDVAAQRAAFLQALSPRPAERVIDVGAGPGLLCAAIAEAVGAEGRVCGVDVSEPLLDFARSRCAAFPQAEFLLADATRLPLPDACFDAAISTQVLEYVPDVDAALAEIRRVLRPGGRAVIVDTDWSTLVWKAPDPLRAARVLAAWNLHVPDPHLPRTLARRLERAGLPLQSAQVLPLFNPAFAEATYSNRLIDLIVAYVSAQGEAGADEAREWASTLRAAGAAGEWFFSLNRYLFIARRA